jgi:hypothetical protein
MALRDQQRRQPPTEESGRTGKEDTHSVTSPTNSADALVMPPRLTINWSNPMDQLTTVLLYQSPHTTDRTMPS